jgi:hypothetical protein
LTGFQYRLGDISLSPNACRVGSSRRLFEILKYDWDFIKIGRLDVRNGLLGRYIRDAIASICRSGRWSARDSDSIFAIVQFTLRGAFTESEYREFGVHYVLKVLSSVKGIPFVLLCPAGLIPRSLLRNLIQSRIY